jgi:hypothetical protein
MRYLLVMLSIVLLSCDADKGLNCFQTAGAIITEEVTVASFDRIVVFERTQLFIEQGAAYKVVIETGENLLNDIKVSVSDGLLTIMNMNGCNLVRDYGLTKVYVTTPTLSEVRSSTGLAIKSVGTLSFPSLTLLSEDIQEEDAFHTDGDFELDINVALLRIETSGLSDFRLTGVATVADYNLLGSHTFIDAGNVISQDVTFFQRSSNHLIVHPIQSLTGDIVNSGNVYANNQPPIVEVTEQYTGRLIFQ